MLTPTSTPMPEVTYTPSPWFKRFWLVLLVAQSGVLISVIVAIARGTPDAYDNQHARLVLTGSGTWLIALSYLLNRPLFKNAALGAAFLLLVTHTVVLR